MIPIVNLVVRASKGGLLSPRKKLVMLLITGVFLAACSKMDPEIKIEQNSEQAFQKEEAAVSANGHFYIATCNMANDRIEVYDSENYTSFDPADAQKWSWKPTTALGYTTAEVDAWAHPYSVSRRKSAIWPGSTEVVAATCRDGLSTICRFVGGTVGQKLWAKNVGAGVYPHGIDVLPNGNVAIAGRKNGAGGWVRVYTSSQGPTSGTYANYNLDWAHGVLWDPALNRLWAIGEVPGGPTDILVALIVGGTAAAPTLTEDLSMRAILPSSGGHDISAFYYRPDTLLVTDHNGVYTYRKSTKTFTPLPGASNRTNVKAISNQAIGHIVQARPNNTLCTLNTWCTIKAEFYDGNTGAWIYNRTRTGAAFYKTDVWWWAYQ